MNHIGIISYTTGAVFFGILSLVLLTGERGRVRKDALTVASITSMIWLGFTAVAIFREASFLSYLLEPLRSFLWLLFLGFILRAPVTDEVLARGRFRGASLVLASFAVLLTMMVIYRIYAGSEGTSIMNFDLLYAGFLLLSVIGLVIIEQIMRNTHVQSRRAVKYLCIGIGVVFAYDFYLYSHALLFRGLDVTAWELRGFVNAMIVPVLGVAILRDPNLLLYVFISRRMVFHTTALLGTGLYLLAMGLGGYYISTFGGEWGTVLQTMFLLGAGLVLLLLLFSGRVRAILRVLINKHFFHYKYDYRDEWLRSINTLSSGSPEDGRMCERVICSLAEIIDSPGGIVWMSDVSKRYVPVASWQMEVSESFEVAADHPMIEFMTSREWLIDLDEYERDPDLYNRLVLPAWVGLLPHAWLVVPLIVHERLVGFVVLARSPVQHQFNWEDSDLIKTAARQAAVHLAQMESSRALAEAKEFEARNRLSTYVMHDLKNLIAQLSLVVTNAAKHKQNPQFMEDAINTVDHSVEKMSKLLANLRSDITQAQEAEDTELCGLLEEVVSTMSNGKPVPSCDFQARNIQLHASRDRLSAIIGHMISNAQDATPDDGRIIVRLFRLGEHAIIEVQDTGTGMDKEFIRTRLFKPFVSTKGKSGMGIGVYETRDYVHKLGGDIEVISRVGEGTTFRIRLPISHVSEKDVKFSKETPDNNKDGQSYTEITGH